MRTLIIAFTLLAAAALVPAAAADEPYDTLEDPEYAVKMAQSDLYKAVDNASREVRQALGPSEPVCRLILDGAQEHGLFQEDVPSADYGYETDWNGAQPSCAELRDQIQHAVYDGESMPYVEKCFKVAYGQSCVALGHWGCDFAIVIGGGLFYECWGGLTPYN